MSPSRSSRMHKWHLNANFFLMSTFPASNFFVKFHELLFVCGVFFLAVKNPEGSPKNRIFKSIDPCTCCFGPNYKRTIKSWKQDGLKIKFSLKTILRLLLANFTVHTTNIFLPKGFSLFFAFKLRSFHQKG